MAQQATFKAIPEVKTFKQLKGQQELGQKKLAEAEDELVKLHVRIKELEDSVQKGELKKKAALERYASNETSLTELKNEVKTHSLEMTQELKNTHELIALVEAAIEKQRDLILQLQPQIQDVSKTIWGRIADIYQKKLDDAIGDTANLLWVAMRNEQPLLRPLLFSDLPERLKQLTTPDPQELRNLSDKLWNEFVGAD